MTDDTDRIVNRLCIDPITARYGPYRIPPGNGDLPRGVDLIPERLRRYRLLDGFDTPVDLHVYIGLAEVGGQLWEQEVRVLLRLGSSGLPGLPEILEGGYVEPELIRKSGPAVRGLAIVTARGSDRSLADPGAADAMRADRVAAVTQFRRLAEALAELHDLGALHRNLTPEAILADLSGNSPRLWIARFEMSALIGNLLRRCVDSTVERDALRGLFLGTEEPDPRRLACLPFERLGFLYPGDLPQPLHETPTSDVFSLAATVWEWFCDPAVLTAEPLPPDVVARHAELHRRMLRALSGAGTVPTRLADLLRTMMDEQPRNRPTAYQVYRQLTEDAEAILWHLEGGDPDRPYLLIDNPAECIPLLAGWGWLDHDQASLPAAREELAALMQEDLAKAILMHSTSGALPFVHSGDTKDRRDCRTVLVGRRAMWFCYQYQRRSWGRFGPALDEALIIKYVSKRDSPAARRCFEDMKAISGMVNIPAVEVVNLDVADSVMDAALAGRPSWKPLLTKLVERTSVEATHHEYAAALDWLLAYQGAELQARTYAYVRTDVSHGRATIEWDRDREAKMINSDALLTKFADSPWLRPPMGDFFLRLEDDEGSATVEIGSDRDGRPQFTQGRSIWSVAPDRAGAIRVVLVRAEGTDPIPERGWIRPGADRGTRTALARQAIGRIDLMRGRGLLGQLHSPRAVRLPPQRYADAGRALTGEDSRKVVRDMLTHRPFFAIQGPPGTGKTTVVTEAVQKFLEQEPSARVLISAQSGYALDNLARRILTKLDELGPDGKPTGKMDVTALRVTSRSGARPDERVQPWTRDALAVRSADRIRERLDDLLGDEVQPKVAVALRRWRDLLDPSSGENVLPELGDRLERAADLVFATCVTATPEAVTPGGTRSRFEWVIVEEAAKAWPTELAMPLTRGTAWTLIGDHKQLGAHRRNNFKRFLDDCAGDTAPELAMLAERREVYLNAFDTFRHLFELSTEGDPVDRDRRQLPLRQLTTQFRMREPIAEVVSRVFYPTSPDTGSDGLPPGLLRSWGGVPAAPLRSPAQLVGQSVVWLDTHDVPECSDEPHWLNRGEAELVQALIERLRPHPSPHQHGYSGEPLAVLTPYRAQARLLTQHDMLRPHVSTIHAFQGREADIVVVSLVRDRRHGPPGVPWSSLGHLTQPNLINVMMSRARRLLVIVGDFQHFATVDEVTTSVPGTSEDGPFWGRLCTAVRHFGTVLPAREVIDR